MCDTKIDFLYLSEQDMIDAGVLDAGRCVETMEETMKLLSKGDYFEGGPNRNAHGIMLNFPEKSDISDFPLNDSRDRRFMAMPAYLGGRFHLAGQKWYGSNGRNTGKGLPRSILMVTLNDVETGAPVSYMSANLLSAMRTGAMPGLCAKYLAKKDSKVVSLVGPGVINKTCLMAYMAYFKDIDTIKIKGRSPTSKTAKDTYDFIKEKYPQVKNVIICDTLEEAVKDADIVSEAMSTEKGKWPSFKMEWFKKGSVVISTGSFWLDNFDDMLGASMVVDNYPMYVDYVKNFQVPDEKTGKVEPMAIMGMHFVNHVNKGKVERKAVRNIGDIILGKEPGRVSDDEIFLIGIGGLPIEDIAWGYECYNKAKEMGIGTKLNLWDAPYMH